jgi:hypothetical protein
VDDGLMTALDFVQFKNWRVRYHYNVLSKLPPLVFVVLVGGVCVVPGCSSSFCD